MNTGFDEASDKYAEEFDYLDELRDSGEVNMFGAAPYLANTFNIDNREARQILLLWMASFEEE